MNQPEPTAGCRGCGALVLIALKDKHRDVCPAALKNSLYQYRQTHGGDHIKLEDALNHLTALTAAHTEDLKSFDDDTVDIFKRLETLETRPTSDDAPQAAGVQISGWLDDDTDAPLDDILDAALEDEPAAAAEPEPDPESPVAPLTVVQPVYSTATNPADIDDLEARIAAQTGRINP